MNPPSFKLASFEFSRFPDMPVTKALSFSPCYFLQHVQDKHHNFTFYITLGCNDKFLLNAKLIKNKLTLRVCCSVSGVLA